MQFVQFKRHGQPCRWVLVCIVWSLVLPEGMWSVLWAQPMPPPPPPSVPPPTLNEGATTWPSLSLSQKNAAATKARALWPSSLVCDQHHPFDQTLRLMQLKRIVLIFREANAEDITNENYPELLKSMDFANVDIAELIKPMSEMTGKNFIIGPGVQGKITIISPTQVTVAEAYQAFLSALAIHKLTVVPSGRYLKIQPIGEVPQGELFSGPYTPNFDQYITRVIQLEHVQSNELVAQITSASYSRYW